MFNAKKISILLLAMVMAIGLLTMPVFAQNQPPHTPVPTVAPTIAPTREPLVTTLTQDEITTLFTPAYSTALQKVVVTLGEGQVFIDFEGIGPTFKKQQFNAVAVPQFVPVVGKITWIVTAMTLDGQPMSEVIFTTWARRVHNMLDARMPKRFKGYIVTAVDITPDELTYTQALR